ncbi:LuxR C-terminal-related transcriptional regulator [Dactylosporangium sp. NPDC049525]|uniref:LuxR C-terminal-related transcriptional regulator n=1 Tax=Dactylosporangium sp. NPDC049525 TaxID=3154730 RepID=UPI0034270D20
MVSALTVQKVSLRGRDADRAAIATLLAAAAEGHGGALVVAGPVGIGRSALLAAAVPASGPAAVPAAAAASAAAVELSVAGCPAETGLPYAGLHRLLAGALPFPRPGCHDGAAPDRLTAGLATLAALRALGGKARGPVVCRIDDAQWLDRPSLDALALAARRAGGDRIALLFALRDTPGCAGSEASLAGLPYRRLAPLDLRDSRDLLTDAVPDLAGDVAGVLAGMAGGNPRALVELAGALHAEQRRGQAAPPDTLPRDSPLRREYRAVLRALPDATRRVLLLAATAALTAARSPDGRPGCDVAVLLAAGHQPADLAAAERADLVHVDDGQVRFVPPLFAPVLYAEAALGERHAAHRLLAGLPSGEPGATLTAALHLAAVADGPDDALAGVLADAAADVPPALAATALRHAAALTSAPVLAASRTLAAARLAWRGGEPHQARMLLRSVFAPGVPEHLHAERELLLGEIDLRTGASGGEQHTLIAAAGRLIARDRQRSLGALMLAGEALLATGRHDQFIALAGRALRLRRPDDPIGAVLLFEHLTGVSALFSGEPSRAVEPMRRVLHLAAAVDDPPTLVRAAGAGILIGEDQQAYRLAVRAARLAGGAGDRASVPHALDLAATAAFALGDLDLAVATATEGQRLAAATGQDAVADNCRGMLAVVLGMLGDGPASQAWARRCRARAGVDVDSQARAMCVWAAALLDVAEGRYADAAGRLWGVMRTAGGRGHLGVQIPATPTLVEAVARCGDRAPARQILWAYDLWASSTANPTWLALSARCHALLADTEDEADARFREAIRLHLAGDSPFARARTELLYGEELRRRRHPAAAREHLRRALATFEQFGAAPWAQRTAAELRAAGDHVAPMVVEEARPALTAQQARIAELVAGGATNREVAEVLFLSPRTVDHHLRNIFTRLGVRSRTELAKVVS